MSDNKKELAQALAAFFGSYTQAKRDKRKDDEEYRRWNLMYGLRNQDSQRLQESHELNMRIMQIQLYNQLEASELKDRIGAEIKAATGHEPEYWDAIRPYNQDQREAQRFAWETEMFPLEKAGKQASNEYTRRLAANVGGGGGGGGQFPKIPSPDEILAASGRTGDAVRMGMLKSRLKYIDDLVSESLRREPDGSDPGAYRAWQDGHSLVTKSRDDVFNEINALETDAYMMAAGPEEKKQIEESLKAQQQQQQQQPNFEALKGLGRKRDTKELERSGEYVRPEVDPLAQFKANNPITAWIMGTPGSTEERRAREQEKQSELTRKQKSIESWMYPSASGFMMR